MKTRYFPILLAVAALISASVACDLPSSSTELSLTNARTALDKDAKQPTSTFSPTDTIYVVADLANAPKGTVVSSKWFAVSVAGVDPNTLMDQADITTDQDSFTGTVYFYFPPKTTWPAGSYTVELYLNGAITQSVTYTVQ